MTREELVENAEKAKTARDVALAEISEAHRVLIEAADEALAQFDANANVEETVEEAVAEVEVEGEVIADEVVEAEVEAGAENPVEVKEDVPSEELEDESAPTAEEEEILRKAAEIEAKYQG